MLKGNGTAISAATAGTDYLAGPLSGDVTTSGEVATVGAVQGVALTAGEATLVSQLNGATTRAASASAVAGEQTILTGSTASQTLTLPASTAQASSPNLIVNNASVPWTIAFGSGTTGNRYGVAGSFSLVPGTYVEFFLIGTVWYMGRYSLAPPQIFTAGGTWVPSGTGNAIFACLLVGGGAGGRNGTTGTTGGSGGGGGAVLNDYYLGNVTASQTITIGAVGSANSAGNPSSVGALLTAHGGVSATGGDGQAATLSALSPSAGTAGGFGNTTSGAGGTGGAGFNGFGCGGGGGGGPTSAAGGAGAERIDRTGLARGQLASRLLFHRTVRTRGSRPWIENHIRPRRISERRSGLIGGRLASPLLGPDAETAVLVQSVPKPVWIHRAPSPARCLRHVCRSRGAVPAQPHARPFCRA